MSNAPAAPFISLVIPVYNEAQSVGELYAELVPILASTGRTYEIIFVDDGSRDRTLEVLQALAGVTIISFARNCGKTQALLAGFKEARGEYIITLDGDLQDDPHEIPLFIEALEGGSDLVCGWKQRRLDSFEKRFFSKIANTMTRLLAGSSVHDMNCGFKGYKTLVAKQLELYGDMHRYIPALVGSMGYRVSEVPVHHRARAHGTSKYGFGRLLAGFFDLLTLLFIRRFFDRPMHFFGLFGVLVSFAGLLVLGYLTWVKLALGESIGTRPLLFLGVLLVVVGFQLVSLGLVGELVIRTRGALSVPIRFKRSSYDA